MSPRLAPPSPGGCPWWPRCRAWHCGCVLPLLTASQGRLEGGCLQRGRGYHDALSRWARGWLGHWPAGTTGFAQSTLSGGAASPQGSVSCLGVLPQPCLSPPHRGGAHSLSWVYLFPWFSSHTLGELPSLSRWQTHLPGTPVLWGAHPGHTLGPWAPLLHAVGQQEQGGTGGSVKLCHTPKGEALALSWALLIVSCVCKDLFHVNTSL